jgi:hypothetical protein
MLAEGAACRESFSKVPDPTMSRVLTILLILLYVEVGVLLFFVPWSALWTKNFFVHHYPWIAAVVHNYFVRGAVSGIGLADIGLGIHEFWRWRHKAGAA